MEGSRSILSSFAFFLIEHGLLDKQVALDAVEQSIMNKSSYIEFLTKQKLVNETDVARVAAEYFGFPLFDMNVFKIDLIPAEYLNIPLVKKRLALPLFKKNRLLYMAVSDPTIESLYEIRFLTGLDIRFFIVEVSKLARMMEEVHHVQMLSLVDIQGDETGDHHHHSVSLIEEDTIDVLAYDVDSAPVVNYLNKVIMDAIEMKVSDIHFERYENTCRIRYRRHGVLVPIMSPPPIKLEKYLLARLKVIANLDMAEHRILQEGRFKLNISNKQSVDFRVTVCPTLFGEKIVLRILDPTQVAGSIETLGMNTIQQQHLLAALQRSQGLILVTGPAGNGKTVTLYSSLNFLNSVEKNISTVEDPVEVPISGLNQVNINPPIGLTFANVLRTFLQQDPDIMMAGEIRDLETAEIIIKASQSGHLVLSSLPTTGVLETLSRLMHMGVSPYNLATALSLVISQRLIRVLCDDCKLQENFPDEVLLSNGFKQEEINDLQLYRATSCEKCSHGFVGCTAIFEVMPMTDEIAYAVMQGKGLSEIAELAKKQGMINLWESGLQKVKQGKTSLLELNRVFK